MKKLVKAIIAFVVVSIGVSVINSVKKGENPVDGLISSFQKESKVILSSYEDVYREYSEKMTKQYQTSEKLMRKAVNEKKSIDVLAEVCSTEVDKLATISAEGTDMMAEICTKKHITTNDYMEWSMKLNSEYMDYGMRLESIYMNGATGSFMKDLKEQLKGYGY